MTVLFRTVDAQNGKSPLSSCMLNTLRERRFCFKRHTSKYNSHCKRKVLFRTVCAFILSASLLEAASKNDVLARSQKVLTDAMKANNVRMRVAAENMANSKTADYVPKSVEMRAKNDRKTNTTSVQVNKIIRDDKKMVQTYDPTHPKADANGMVNMPKLDPLMTMMDMQRAKLDNERAMKSYQMTTDMRHRTIKMMNQ